MSTTTTTTLPPGPGDDALVAFARDPLGVQWEWWHTYGDIWTVHAPSGPIVFLAHPDLVQQLLTRHLDHGEIVRRTIPAQGEGITVQDGAAWRRSRLLMQSMFGRPALRALAFLVAEAVDRRLSRLDALAASGEQFDMAAFLGQITIRVLFHAMFSDEFSDDEIDFAVEQLDMISLYKGDLMRSAWAPAGSPIASEAAGQKAVAALDELLYRAISRRRSAGTDSDDLLGRLVAARTDDGERFADDEIRDQLTVLFFGGYETTQWGVAWALACLDAAPAAMSPLRAEVDAVGDRVPDVDDLERLVLARATLDEALRVQSALMLPRQLQEPDTFGGFAIPTGTIVVASPWVLHRRPDLWDEPDAFDPSRFVGDRRKQLHKYQHIPFGGGPRTCLGVNLAYLEAQLMLAMFLRRYDYELPAGFEPRHRHQYSVVIDGGLPMTVRRRRPAVRDNA